METGALLESISLDDGPLQLDATAEGGRPRFSSSNLDDKENPMMNSLLRSKSHHTDEGSGIEDANERYERWRGALEVSAPPSSAAASSQGGDPAVAKRVCDRLVKMACDGVRESRPSALNSMAPSAKARALIASMVARWRLSVQGDASKLDAYVDGGAPYVAALALSSAAPLGSVARQELMMMAAAQQRPTSHQQEQLESLERGAFEIFEAVSNRVNPYGLDMTLADSALDSALKTHLPKIDPELVAKLGGWLAGVEARRTSRVWLGSLFASSDERDATGVWDVLFGSLAQGRRTDFFQSFAVAVVAVLVCRQRQQLLSAAVPELQLFSPRADAEGDYSLARDATAFNDPTTEAEAHEDVQVVTFGEGPLGILLTKRLRGLVVNGFSNEQSEQREAPIVGDSVVAVNGRRLPATATLADAVALLRGVGRPVLVTFKRATTLELTMDKRADEARVSSSRAAAKAPSDDVMPPPPTTTGGGGPAPSPTTGNLQGTVAGRISFYANAAAAAAESFSADSFAAASSEKTKTGSAAASSGIVTAPLSRNASSSSLGGGSGVALSGTAQLGGEPPKPMASAPRAPDGYSVPLLPGEVVFAEVSCVLADVAIPSPRTNGSLAQASFSGELYATSYRLVFHPIGCGAQPPFASVGSQDWECAMRNLSRCELLPKMLSISCKDGQRRRFVVAERAAVQALTLARAVQALAFSRAPDAFARAHYAAVMLEDKEAVLEEPEKEAGARRREAANPALTRAARRSLAMPFMARYSILNEYNQSVLRRYNTAEYPRRGLRVVEQSESLALCDTYPPCLVVPSSMSDMELKRVAAYRSKGRLPVIVWSSRDPASGATISRSSQPKPGVQNKRSSDDERYLDEIRRLSASKRLVIIDARSKVATQGNRMMGLGTELTKYYEGVEIVYGNIANIHAARDALQQVHALCRATEVDAEGTTNTPSWESSSNPTSWLQKLEASTWLRQVHSIISMAVRTVELIHYDKSAVLVHCSDGWDRTPQLTQLAMMLLESRFRTIDGFVALFQKEWVDFGHKFEERCGHCEDSPAEQRSPVMLLFLDCCHQIMRQFPDHFEFGVPFLIAIHDQLHACRYGTFLENSHNQRQSKKIHDQTAPFWWQVADNFDRYKNPTYSPLDHYDTPLIPSLSPHNIKFFEEYFFRYNPTVMPPRPLQTNL